MRGFWQRHTMPQPEGEEGACKDEEGDAPGHGNGLGLLQPAGKHDEETLSDDVADAIEGAADTYVEALVVGAEAKDVEAVGSDVVGGAGEGENPEEGQRALQPVGCGEGEGDAGKPCSDEQLHQQHPPALRLDGSDEGAPQGLDDPRQVEPGGIESQLGVGESKTFVHRGGYDHHGNIGQCLGEVEGGYPGVGLVLHERVFRV